MRTIPFTAAMVAAFCVAGMALAQSAPAVAPELAGRWVAQKRNLVLDIFDAVCPPVPKVS